MRDGQIINPFGMASLKTEGEKIGYIDSSVNVETTVSDSRWIELCHSEKEYSEMEFNVGHITELFKQLTAHLTKEQRYIAIKKIVNDLIPESGY